MKLELIKEESENILSILKKRFNKNMKRHQSLIWSEIQIRLEKNPNKLWALNEMEISGGEPDVISLDKQTDEFLFFDCSKESPQGRRSFCYDQDALESRKKNKPENSAINISQEMGIELLTEEQYKFLQKMGEFDTKTSSWLKTPKKIRKLGGAIFGDFRFGQVFIYHNGAESYYASRGFRGMLKV